MTQSELNEFLGAELSPRPEKNLCVGVGNDALLLLQFMENGAPYQYAVAHHPSVYNGSLVWGNGEYFPFFQYVNSDIPMLDALKDATASLYKS